MDIYFDQSLNRKLSVVKLSVVKLSVVKLSVVKLSKQTLGCPPSLLERAVITDNSADCFPSSRVHPCNAQQRQTLMAADTFLDRGWEALSEIKDKSNVRSKNSNLDLARQSTQAEADAAQINDQFLANSSATGRQATSPQTCGRPRQVLDGCASSTTLNLLNIFMVFRLEYILITVAILSNSLQS